MKSSRTLFVLTLIIILLNALTVEAQNALPESGNVGIGTSTPISPFEVHSFAVETAVSMDVDNSDISNNYVPGNSWQSFTAGVSQNLTKVDLFNAAQANHTGTLYIYAGEGTGGSLLHSQSYETGSVPQGWVSFVLSSGIPLTKGSKYTIRLSRFNWQFSTAYAGGRCGWNAGYDFGIRTYTALTAADQSNPAWGGTFISAKDSWQSFTAGSTNNLSMIELYAYGGAGFTGTLSIYAGEGTGGTLLHSQTYSQTKGHAWNAFALTEAVPITAGQKYTFRLTKFNFMETPGYAGGRAGWNAAKDFRFKTYVSTASAAPTFSVGQGKVAIGYSMESIPADYQLAVNGKVICEELKVQLSENWPDYVFADDYELMPLEEVGKYIATEKHLPGIPSAAEIDGKGIEMGEMQRKMMEKIEELTLYLLQQQAEIDRLKTQIKQQ